MLAEKIQLPELTDPDKVAAELPAQGAPPLFLIAKPDAFAGKAAAIDWIGGNRAALDRLILKHGAVVLRDFPFATAEDFNDAISVFPAYEGGYTAGGAPRSTVSGRAMEATRVANVMRICLHQEMAYLNAYPPRLAFFCVKPAAQGGETIIGDMREFTRRLPEELSERLQRLGVRGIRNYSPAGSDRGTVADPRDGVAWDTGFGTGDRGEVERLCIERGLEPIWREDGGLIVINRLNPWARHPVTGDSLYRSLIHTHNLNNETFELTHKVNGEYGTGYTFGDGTALTLDEARAMFDIFDDIEVSWPWRTGDLMIVDNLLTAHGRNTYEGDRQTLVALLA